MRRSAGLVFDEIMDVEGTGTESAPLVDEMETSCELDGLLAATDQMGIQVVVDEVSAPTSPWVVIPQVVVQILTSSDGIHWALKSTTPQVPAFDVPPGATTVSPYGGDSGLLPTLVFARLQVSFLASSGPAKAHVRVYVTLRDGGDVHEVDKAPKWLVPISM